ncbi:unnamed protein product [Discula destructiva]
MAPVADPPDDNIGTRLARSGLRNLGPPSLRDADTNVRDEALSGIVPLRDGLVRRQNDPDIDDEYAIPASQQGEKDQLSPLGLLAAIPAAIASSPLTNFAAFLPTLMQANGLPTVSTSSTTPSTTPVPALTTSLMSTTQRPPPTTSTLTSQIKSETALPSSAKDTSAALNPEMPTATLVTTTALPISTPDTLASSLFPSSTTIDPQSAAAAEYSTPSPSIFITNSDDSDLSRSGASRDGYSNVPSGGLNSVAERVLISAGSIGAFVLICFGCWIGWRMYKKHDRARNSMDNNDYATPNTLLAKVPYFGRDQQAWLDNYSADVPRSIPSYESANKSIAMGATVSIYSMDSRPHMAKPSERQGPLVLPQLDTNVAFSPLFYSRLNNFSASVSSSSPYGTTPSRVVQTPESLSIQQSSPYADQQLLTTRPQMQTSYNTNSALNDPFASPEDAYVAAEFCLNRTAQHDGEVAMQTILTTATDPSNPSQSLGHSDQSELVRSPFTTHNPNVRAINRASELSSISSGFGDGDIIVPPPAAHQQDPDSRPISYAETANGSSRFETTANQIEAGGNGQRDTTYTAASEDAAVRYRSVNSWVNQQTGQVARQQLQREGTEDIPPVPLLPPEQRLTMMMDDGEEPRRYEDTLSSQPHLPTLQTQHLGAGTAPDARDGSTS